jgi:hypothetical protein
MDAVIETFRVEIVPCGCHAEDLDEGDFRERTVSDGECDRAEAADLVL